MRALFSFAILAVALSGCDGCSKGADGAAEAGVDAAAPASSTGRTDYPMKVTPVPLAARLCDALHTLPGKRIAECCGGPSSGLLADECARLLSASLADRVVTVDEGKVTACAKAMEASLVGCDWVTPSEPPLPAECKDLVQGQLGASARCRSSLDCKPSFHCGEGNICTAGEKVGAVCGRSVDALAVSTRQTDVETSHPTCAAHCSLVAHKCEEMPEAGAQCYANPGCGSGHLCVDGKCTAAVAGAQGQPCAGTTCADGLRCIAKTCVPKAATNETCANDFDCAKGGCAASDGGRRCGMTCTHAGDLDAIRKVLSAPIVKPSASPK